MAYAIIHFIDKALHKERPALQLRLEIVREASREAHAGMVCKIRRAVDGGDEKRQRLETDPGGPSLWQLCLGRSLRQPSAQWRRMA